MTAFTVEVDDNGLDSVLSFLEKRFGDVSPALMQIGEDIVERTKQRFASSTGPDGEPWKALAESTMLGYLQSRKKNFNKDGSLSAGGMQRLIGRKPLLGESGALSTQIFWSVTGNELEVGSTMPYAAAQQFGATTKAHDIVARNKEALAFNGFVFKRVHHPGSTIPARPFLPITASGELYPADRDAILAVLGQYLVGE